MTDSAILRVETAKSIGMKSQETILIYYLKNVDF